MESMQYHSLVMIIFRSFVTDDPMRDTARFSTASTAMLGSTAGEIVSGSKTCLQTLLHLFYHCHGFEAYHIFLLQIFEQLGFDSIRRLRKLKSLGKDQTRESKAFRITLMLCAKGLDDQGQNFYLSECVSRVLRDEMDSCDVKEFQDWVPAKGNQAREPLMKEYVHSEYPVNIVSITQDPSDRRLHRLLEKIPALPEHRISSRGTDMDQEDVRRENLRQEGGSSRSWRNVIFEQ